MAVKRPENGVYLEIRNNQKATFQMKKKQISSGESQVQDTWVSLPLEHTQKGKVAKVSRT